MSDHRATELFEICLKQGMKKFSFEEDKHFGYYRSFAYCMEHFHDLLCEIEDRYPDIKNIVKAKCDSLTLSN